MLGHFVASLESIAALQLYLFVASDQGTFVSSGIWILRSWDSCVGEGCSFQHCSRIRGGGASVSRGRGLLTHRMCALLHSCRLVGPEQIACKDLTAYIIKIGGPPVCDDHIAFLLEGI